jgi:hypothetical protein
MIVDKKPIETWAINLSANSFLFCFNGNDNLSSIIVQCVWVLIFNEELVVWIM